MRALYPLSLCIKSRLSGNGRHESNQRERAEAARGKRTGSITESHLGTSGGRFYLPVRLRHKTGAACDVHIDI